MGRRNPDSDQIGRSWISKLGRREVVGVAETPGGLRFMVRTSDSGLPELIRPDELERTIVIDEKNAASRSAARDTSAVEAQRGVDAQSRAVGGPRALEFLAMMSPKARGKALQALLRTRSWDGEIKSTGRGVADKVDQGFTVVQGRTGRRLEAPDGRFLDERQITKTGMDLAEYLSARSSNPDRLRAEREAARRLAAGG